MLHSTTLRAAMAAMAAVLSSTGKQDYVSTRTCQKDTLWISTECSADAQDEFRSTSDQLVANQGEITIQYGISIV